MDDPELSDEEIFGVRQMILDGITPDGLWNEGAIGYQFFAMQAFMLSTEAAAHQGGAGSAASGSASTQRHSGASCQYT